MLRTSVLFPVTGVIVRILDIADFQTGVLPHILFLSLEVDDQLPVETVEKVIVGNGCLEQRNLDTGHLPYYRLHGDALAAGIGDETDGVNKVTLALEEGIPYENLDTVAAYTALGNGYGVIHGSDLTHDGDLAVLVEIYQGVGGREEPAVSCLIGLLQSPDAHQPVDGDSLSPLRKSKP